MEGKSRIVWVVLWALHVLDGDESKERAMPAVRHLTDGFHAQTGDVRGEDLRLHFV